MCTPSTPCIAAVAAPIPPMGRKILYWRVQCPGRYRRAQAPSPSPMPHQKIMISTLPFVPEPETWTCYPRAHMTSLDSPTIVVPHGALEWWQAIKVSVHKPVYSGYLTKLDEWAGCPAPPAVPGQYPQIQYLPKGCLTRREALGVCSYRAGGCKGVLSSFPAAPRQQEQECCPWTSGLS